MKVVELQHPKPSPHVAELRRLLGRDNCMAGGGPDHSVYGFRFDTADEANEAVEKIWSKWPAMNVTFK